MLEPAIDRLVELITYVALIFSVIFLGAAILLALYYLRSCLKRSCWHGEVDLVPKYSSDTELGLMNGMVFGRSFGYVLPNSIFRSFIVERSARSTLLINSKFMKQQWKSPRSGCHVTWASSADDGSDETEEL